MKTKWECIRNPSYAYGFQVNGIYEQSNYRNRYMNEDEIFILNSRGNKQLVKKEDFRKL